MTTVYLLGGLVIALYAIATYTDIREFRIPNWVSVGLILAYIIRMLTMPEFVGWSEVGFDLAAFAAVLVVGFGLYALAWFGAGDVKLMAAGTLFVTHSTALEYVLTTMLLGGAVALVILIISQVRKAFPVLAAKTPWAEGFSEYMPYGIAISVSGIIWAVEWIHSQMPV
ncbi:MAG: prepilin peptidase [Alphaproteobacteria bacterium]